MGVEGMDMWGWRELMCEGGGSGCVRVEGVDVRGWREWMCGGGGADVWGWREWMCEGGRRGCVVVGEWMCGGGGSFHGIAGTTSATMSPTPHRRSVHSITIPTSVGSLQPRSIYFAMRKYISPLYNS